MSTSPSPAPDGSAAAVLAASRLRLIVTAVVVIVAVAVTVGYFWMGRGPAGSAGDERTETPVDNSSPRPSRQSPGAPSQSSSGGIPSEQATPSDSGGPSPGVEAGPLPAPGGEGEAIPAPLRGITLDTTENIDSSASVIATSSSTLTVRIVMDPGVSISQYRAAIERIDPHAYIMVEIADSEEMPDLTAAQIRERSRQALVAFGDKVDLWEVGNELNGDWVGTSPDEINAKALAAYEEIRAGGGKTAVTLNYWSSSDCIAEPWESTLEYAATMPAELRQVDYVFLSIYETACEPVQHPSAGQIGATLKSLSTVFPNARLGIGEVGAQTSLDGSSQPDTAEKTRVADYYYGLQGELSSIVGERYVGGYFWWYFRRDVLEASDRESLWPKLDSLTSDL